MKRVHTALALAGACALASCNGDPGGWYPKMDCTQRDLATGVCTAATYSCEPPRNLLAYYVDGPRCFVRGAR